MSRYSKIAGEVDAFAAADILISRTDQRGVIQTFNHGFQRVSGYDWSELSGAPHKTVRHPDMPKGFYWLFWNYLQQGKPMGGFVKNLAKDGSFYWVYALLSSHEDQYVSTRVKATSDAIQKIAPMYEKFLKLEEEEGLTPEQSATAICKHLEDVEGYRSYSEFMCAMAADQVQARANALNLPSDPVVEGMNKVADLWQDVRDQCQSIFKSYSLIAHTPLNLRVQAARMGDAGIALSVIASNFRDLATQISEMIENFEGQSTEVASQLDQGRFIVSTSELLSEAVKDIQEESGTDSAFDFEAEVEALNLQREDSRKHGQEVMDTTSRAVSRFADVLRDTSRVLSGLSVSRVMCKIENAYVTSNMASGMEGTISELSKFQEDAHASLQAAQTILPRIEETISQINTHLGSRSALGTGPHSRTATEATAA